MRARFPLVASFAVWVGCAPAPAETPPSPDEAPIAVPEIEVESPAPVASASAIPTAKRADLGPPRGPHGGMWGDSVGEAFGAGGLGLSGIGNNAGGIGLGSVGTIGPGTGYGGFGRKRGAPPATLRVGTTKVNGKLPPEVIRRVVRANFGRFRLCYETGRKKDPNLAGRVEVDFVIDPNGLVTKATTGGTMIAKVAVCVARAFYKISFPPPVGGGLVQVHYPITFAPGRVTKKAPPKKP